jgi:hypothetical protein
MKKLFALSLLALAGLANAGGVAKATSNGGNYIILSDTTSEQCKEYEAELGGSWNYMEIRNPRTSQVTARGCWHNTGDGRVSVYYSDGTNYSYLFSFFELTDYYQAKYGSKKTTN